MHISAAYLQQCATMTEESGNNRHAGLNGNVAAKLDQSEPAKPSPGYIQGGGGGGGRLKFFKDGKFILELKRALEGERVSWVSVPRKTFWPPQGTAPSTTPTYRQESSTSLSVSDDNSSIQSSPWQRDHSWKQSSPRKNQSQELNLYFWRAKSQRCRNNNRNRKLCRQPYIDSDVKIKTECNRNQSKRRPLLAIIQSLIDRNNTRTNTPPRPEMVVSPRKRFLREMENTKPQSDESKRCKNKQPIKATTNGVDVVTCNAAAVAPPPVRNCSYSITSLLADDRKPNTSPSGGQFCTDERWYSESVDKLRSIELSQVDKLRAPFVPTYLPPSYMFNPFPPYYGAYRGGYVMPPPPLGAYAAPPPPLVRGSTSAPSCSWTDPIATASDDRTDSDMPLNLSKH